jgi:two-component system, response regulator PdtaR
LNTQPIILVVEDEMLVRMLAVEVLTEAGFTVLESANADEALTILEAQPDIQVLFTDVNMPGSLDGFALAEIVQTRWPEIRILIGSGRIRPGPTEVPTGMRFMAKPYAPCALTGAVCALVPEP